MQMPENGKRLELVKGELVDMPPAGYAYGRVASRIDRGIGNYVEQYDLGEVVISEASFRIAQNPDTVRVPDIAFLCKEHVPHGPAPQGFIDQAPDLVVEVASPTDSASSFQAKLEQWLAAGVQLVWVAYPNTKSVVVYNAQREGKLLRAEDMLTGDPVLPGFSCKVSEIFN